MKPHVLVIGARGMQDFILAGYLAHQYVESGFDKRIPSGRSHGVIYGTGDSMDMTAHAYVWHSRTQITVHFG